MDMVIYLTLIIQIYLMKLYGQKNSCNFQNQVCYFYDPIEDIPRQYRLGGAITIYAHNKVEVKAEECCFVETNLALSNRPMIRGWDSVGGQSEAGATNKGSGTVNLFKICTGTFKKTLVTIRPKCNGRLQCQQVANIKRLYKWRNTAALLRQISHCQTDP